MISKADIQRFEAKINKLGRFMPGMKTRCHEWTGSNKPNGYGRIGWLGTVRLAHRVAFFIKHGRWPTPQALHRCDNRACVRFSHLREGTAKNNTDDMIRKGRRRNGVSIGTQNGNAKLPVSAVRKIRVAYATGRFKQQTLAERFGISQNHVSTIVRGRQRKDAGCVSIRLL